jgi:hypothetical protein
MPKYLKTNKESEEIYMAKKKGVWISFFGARCPGTAHPKIGHRTLKKTKKSTPLFLAM